MADTFGATTEATINPNALKPPVPALYGGRGLRPLAEIQEDLKRPIPAELLFWKPGKGGSKMLLYWPWWVGVRAFDKMAPGWSLELSSPVISSDGHVSIVAKVFIPCLENSYPGFFKSSSGGDYEGTKEAQQVQGSSGTYTKEATFGKGFDPVLDAERQAMCRAMSNWGFGFDLYVPEKLRLHKWVEPPPPDDEPWKYPNRQQGGSYKGKGR